MEGPEELGQLPQEPLDAEPQFGPYTPGQILDGLSYSADLRDATDKAWADGDDALAESLLAEQGRSASKSLIEQTITGGDPVASTIPSAAFIDPEIEKARRFSAFEIQEKGVDEVLEQGMWSDFTDYSASIWNQYYERNNAKLKQWKPNMSPEEELAFRQQLERAEVDPNVHAEMQQRLVMLDQELKKMNPKFSVYTHPKTREVAQFMNQRAYYTMGEQPYDYTAGYEFMPDWMAETVSRTGHVAQAAMKGITYLPYHMVEGTAALAMTGISNITNGRGEDYWNIPTAAVVDHTGEVVHNAPKVHPEVHQQLNLWTNLLWSEAEKSAADNADAWREAQNAGLPWLVEGMAHLGGSLVGFGPAAKAWHAGSAGMKYLANLGYTAQAATRTRKMIDVVAGTTGAAIAGGTVDAVSFGKHEGFAKSFTHGLIATPLYLAIGALGRGTERALKSKTMPKKVQDTIAKTMGGVTEGAGLGGLEIHNLSPLWNFMRDPTEENWKEHGAVMLKNILALALFKGMGPGLPGEPGKVAEETLGRELLSGMFEREVKTAAREAYETKDPARREEILEAARKEGFSDADVMEIGRATSEQTAARGRDPGRSRELRAETEAKVTEATTKAQKMDRPETSRREERWEEQKEAEVLGMSVRETPEGPREGRRIAREPLPSERVSEGKKAEKAQEEAISRPELEGSAALRPEGGPEHMEARTKKTIRESDIDLLLQGRPARKGILGVGAREGDPVQVPMRRKRMKYAKAAEGYLQTREDLVRIDPKVAHRLTVKAHEFAHAMQKKMFGGFKMDAMRDAGFSEQALRELADLGLPTSGPRFNTQQKVAEGWAELVARKLLGDARLQSEFPTIDREFGNWISDPAQRRMKMQYDVIADAYKTWREMGSVARAKGKIQPKEGARLTEVQKDVRPGVRERLDRYIGKKLDDGTAFKQSWKRWMDVSGNDPNAMHISERPGDLADALKMTAPHVAENMLRGEMTNLAGDRVGRSMKERLSEIPKGKTEDFWGYMKSRMELEMMDKGLETGTTRQEALRVVDTLGRDNPAFGGIAKDVTDWFHNLVDYVAEAGGYTEAQARAIKDSYQVYIPFARMAERGGEMTGRRGRQKAEADVGPGERTGSDMPILDPAEAMVRMTTSMLVRAQKAQVLRSMWTNHLLLDGMGGFVTDVSRDVVPNEVKLKDVADHLDKMDLPGDKKHEMETAAEIIRQLGDGQFEAITMFTQKAVPGKGDVVAYTPSYTPKQVEAMVKRRRDLSEKTGEELEADLAQFEKRLLDSNGKLKWLEMDPDAFETFMGMEVPAEVMTGLLGTMAKSAATVTRHAAVAANPLFTLRNIARDFLQYGLYSKHTSAVPFMAELMGVYRSILKGGDANRLMDALGAKVATRATGEVMAPTGAKGDAVFSATDPGVVGKINSSVKGAYRSYIDFLGRSERIMRRAEFQATREKLLKEGHSEYDANMQALLDSKEVSVNFTRSAATLRALNKIYPFLNAGVQGNRKFLRHLAGQEGPGTMKFLANGMSRLTMMSAVVYFLNGQEDWYRDLPEWQRRNYWNFDLFGKKFAVPKPFEAGAFFTNPFEYALDQATDAEGKLAGGEMAFDMIKGYMNNGTILPAMVTPIAEAMGNVSFFRGRQIVPEWMQRQKLPKDQFDAYTSKWSKWISETWFPGVSPMHIENFVGGYSAGVGIELGRMLTGEAPRVGRTMMSAKHKGSEFVRDFYDIREEMLQAKGSGEMTSAQRASYKAFQEAKKRLSAINKKMNSGKMDRVAGNRKKYEIARAAVKQYRSRNAK